MERGPTFGRDDVIEDIAQRLGAGEKVLVYGPPGIGKTHIMREVLHEMSADTALVFDGRSIRSREDFDQLLAHALSLSVLEDDPVLVQQQLFSALADRQDVVVAIDDVDQIQEAILQEVVLFLDKFRVLLTARNLTQLEGVAAIPLSPLSVDDAGELYQHATRRVLSGHASEESKAESGVVEQLVRRLDCLPLAIVLAASRAKVLTSQEILDRLNRRFELLRSEDRALEAAVEESWVELGVKEADTLAQAAVFQSGFDMEAAEAVILTEDGTWVGDGLEELVERSLIQRTQGSGARFYLLESIREFAIERADPIRLREARARHASHYLLRAREFFANVSSPDGRSILRKTLRDLNNFLAAMETFRATDAASGARILLDLEATLEVQGVASHYLSLLDSFHGSVSDDSPIRVELDVARLRRLTELGRLTEAALVQEELELQLKDAVPNTKAHASLAHGHLLRQIGRPHEALEVWRAGLEQSEDPFLSFQMKLELGFLQIDRARFGQEDNEPIVQEARTLLQEAHQYARDSARALHRARPAVGWALVLHLQGESDRAIGVLHETLEEQTQLGLTAGRTTCLYYLAMLESQVGDPHQALALAAEVDAELRRSGMLARRARNLAARASYANIAGELGEATRLAVAALDACEYHGLTIPALTADIQRALLAWEADDIPLARLHIERARNAAREIHSHSHEAVPMAYEAFIIAGEGDLLRALSLIETAIEWMGESAEMRGPPEAPRVTFYDRMWTAMTRLCGAQQLMSQGHWSEVYQAIDDIEEAASRYTQTWSLITRRHARKVVEDTLSGLNLPRKKPDGLLRVISGHEYQLDDQEIIDLSLQIVPARVLKFLVDRHKNGQGASQLSEVIEAGWPGEYISPDSAANRVDNVMHILRNLGLHEVIETHDGYRIKETILLRDESEPSV